MTAASGGTAPLYQADLYSAQEQVMGELGTIGSARPTSQRADRRVILGDGIGRPPRRGTSFALAGLPARQAAHRPESCEALSRDRERRKGGTMSESCAMHQEATSPSVFGPTLTSRVRRSLRCSPPLVSPRRPLFGNSPYLDGP